MVFKQEMENIAVEASKTLTIKYHIEQLKEELSVHKTKAESGRTKLHLSGSGNWV